MKGTNTKAIMAVIVGGVTAYFNAVAIPLVVLMVAMAIDYVSGMTKAWVTGELSSRTGVVGIIKKVGYLTVICVAAIVDWLLMSGLHKVGISVGMDFCFGVMCTIWFIINECISILENLAVIGVPLPRFLTAMIKRLAAVVDEKGEDKQ
jgi:toxin secretion/phage lysis holin